MDLAVALYRFEMFGSTEARPHVLWRHDIDMSPHRAVRLAQVEASAGVHATYFVHCHSPFYSILEGSVRDRLRAILDLGHAIGLHFEASFYGPVGDGRDLERHLTRERDLLEDLLGVSIDTFSFHNPERDGVLSFDEDQYASMTNAYSRSLRERYLYVSDSNGYWRFGSLREALTSGASRLHVLTHPEWWTPAPMAPRRRVARSIGGRARAVARDYDDALAALGRRNVGK